MGPFLNNPELLIPILSPPGLRTPQAPYPPTPPVPLPLPLSPRHRTPQAPRPPTPSGSSNTSPSHSPASSFIPTSYGCHTPQAPRPPTPPVPFPRPNSSSTPPRVLFPNLTSSFLSFLCSRTVAPVQFINRFFFDLRIEF
ncbi:hypothetical protein ACSQ67_024545 [Phaseolus vulgaris]